MTQKIKRPISVLLTVMMIVGVFTALPITAHAESAVTDTLTAADFAATSTTYTNFSNVSKVSDAVYAGNSAKSSAGDIQLRTTNSNSGIVTTESGGAAKKIEVSWNSSTTIGRTLNVYGKNTAYSAATDLYNNSTRGTLLGSIVYGTSTELVIDGSYEFIGLRSSSNAMYLTEINITWAVEGSTQRYAVTWDCDNGEEPETVSYEENAIPSYDGIPEKAPTNDTVYTFSGWSNGTTDYAPDEALPPVTGNVTYTALYNESPRTYTVTWKNGNAVLETDYDLLYNAAAEFNGTTPEKASDAQYTYTFDGWQSSADGQVYAASAIPNVTRDVTYTAHFSETLNKYTVTWKNEDGSTLYSEELDYNGSAAPAYDPSKGGELTKPETEDYTYVFSGWDPEPAPVTGNAEYTAVFTAKSKHEKVDVLNRALTGITGVSYGEWSGKTSESTAVYAGQSAGGNSSIQLRSENSNAGIITTESGGTVQSIKVIWESHTANGRTLNIYGKHTAYSAATDLYNASTQGDLLGTIVCGASDELVLDGSYEYIGLRSNSGAMYLTEVDITWITADDTPEHTVTWKNGDTVIYSEQVKENRVPFLDLDVYGVPEKAEDEDYTYRFSGWTTVGGDDTVYANDNLPQVGTADVTYQAYFTPRSKYSQVDTLTADIFTATTSLYRSFSDVKYPADGINSDAVYAGSTANRSGSIQLRNGQQSCIVTTASGGRAAKVRVVWDSTTTAGQKIDIYGKDTPYPSEDWYGSIGSLLGTITYGESTELELAVPYEHIAIRSKSGTVYLEKIDITWDVTPPQPHTVTWKNGETVIYSEELDYGVSPVYNEAAYGTPQKPDDTARYTFAGWTDGSNTYPSAASLPPLKTDTTYTAVYDSTPIHTVTWLNRNGDLLDSFTFFGSDAPVQAVYEGSTPANADDSYYSYVFLGWKDSSGNRYYDISDIPALYSGETFTAIYQSSPKIKSGRIVPTNDGTVYNTGGKYCKTSPDSEIKFFEENYPFTDTVTDDGSGTLTIGGEEIAITKPLGEPTAAKPTISVFAHTCYVTGEGTLDDPFVFYPNYVYSANVENVQDSTTIDIYDPFLHPGDGLKGMARVRMHDAYIRFLQYEDNTDLECAHGTNGFMGVTHTQYGNRYAKAEALPYTFVGSDTIYFLGELTNAYNFSENLELDNELGNVTPYYTVTWANWNGETIRTNKVFQGLHPSYGNIAGSVPTRPDDENYRYTFSGWTDGTNVYAPDAELPAVTGDITYTATYTRRELTPYYITWLNDDGTVLATDSFFYGDIPEYTGATPQKSTDPMKYTFTGWTPEISEVTGNAEYTATYSPKKLFAGHSLSLQGDIGIYFYLDVTAAGITPEDIIGGNNSIAINYSWKTSPAPYTDLSLDNIVLDKAYCEANPDAFDSNYSNPTGGLFKVKCNTAVAEMSCIVNADADVKDGSGTTVYTEDNDYSVRDYGMYIINNPDKFGSDLVNLAKAMLDYGAKAQVVFGIATDSPANADVDYTMQNVTPAMIEEAVSAANSGLSQSDMRANTGSFGAQYYGTTIVYLTKTTLRHYYTVTNQSSFDAAKNNTGSFVFSDKKDPYMMFELSNIAANQLDTLQPLTIGGQTYYYSVLDYSKSILSNANSTQANRELAAATYWYNHFANIYLG